jgi:hypothetical protein
MAFSFYPMAVNVAGNAPFQRFRAKADDLSNYAGINPGMRGLRRAQVRAALLFPRHT